MALCTVSSVCALLILAHTDLWNLERLCRIEVGCDSWIGMSDPNRALCAG
jgi:hypothetical protein